MPSHTCRKFRYPGEREAKNALRRLHRQSRGNRGKRHHKECRVYHCPHCNGWHLTSDRNP